MKHLISASVLAVALSAGTTVSADVDKDAHPAVKYRHDLMSSLGDHAGAVSAIMKKQAGDTSHLEALFRAIALTASISTDAFSVQEPGGETMQAFWDDGEKALAGFKDMEMKATEAANAMATGGLAAARKPMNELFGTCKACHDDYKK